MRKSVLFLLVVMGLYLAVLPVAAQENAQKVGEGYTSEGVYYEVYKLENITPDEISIDASGIKVTRQLAFQGCVIPSKEIFWRESVNEVFYCGMLTLSGYSYNSSQTIATYSGTLYKE